LQPEYKRMSEMIDLRQRV